MNGLLTDIYEAIPGLTLTKATISNFFMLETILWQFFVEHARSLLQGYPFTVGVIISYIKLKQIETSNIVSIANGKYLAIDNDRIRSSLVLSRG